MYVGRRAWDGECVWAPRYTSKLTGTKSLAKSASQGCQVPSSLPSPPLLHTCRHAQFCEPCESGRVFACSWRVSLDARSGCVWMHPVACYGGLQRRVAVGLRVQQLSGGRQASVCKGCTQPSEPHALLDGDRKAVSARADAAEQACVVADVLHAARSWRRFLQRSATGLGQMQGCPS